MARPGQRRRRPSRHRSASRRRPTPRGGSASAAGPPSTHTPCAGLGPTRTPATSVVTWATTAGPVRSSWKNARSKSTGKRPTAATAKHAARSRREGRGPRVQAGSAPGRQIGVTSAGSAHGPPRLAGAATAGQEPDRHPEAETRKAGTQGEVTAETITTALAVTAVAGGTVTAGPAPGRRAA